MGTNVQVDSASAECTQTMSGALMLIESLKKEKVEMIFGYPGGAVLPIYESYTIQGWYISFPVTNKEQFMQRRDTQGSPENRVSSLPRQGRERQTLLQVLLMP